MTGLETDLADIGDRLQTAWHADARQARRHHHVLVATALVTLLALTGAAIASDVLPFNITKSNRSPTTAALTNLHATYQPTTKPLKPWQTALKLDFTKAVTIATVTNRETGPLAIVLVPAGRHGLCVAAARPDGSSYLNGCTTQPTPGGDSFNLKVTNEGTTKDGVRYPPLGLSVHTAPPGAARIDVRARDASKLPAIISHGWLVFLNPRPSGAAVLVRVYDSAGTRLLSYYG